MDTFLEKADFFLNLEDVYKRQNQCYVAGVNRMGTDPACEYSGGSAIIDPYGKTIAEWDVYKRQDPGNNFLPLLVGQVSAYLVKGV